MQDVLPTKRRWSPVPPFAWKAKSASLPTPGEPCYRCLSRLFGENALTCVEAGVMAPLVGVIGSLQAMEAIKVLAHYGTPAAGKIVMYDAMTCQFREMKLMSNPGCEVCGR